MRCVILSRALIDAPNETKSLRVVSLPSQCCAASTTNGTPIESVQLRVETPLSRQFRRAWWRIRGLGFIICWRTTLRSVVESIGCGLGVGRECESFNFFCRFFLLVVRLRKWLRRKVPGLRCGSMFILDQRKKIIIIIPVCHSIY